MKTDTKVQQNDDEVIDEIMNDRYQYSIKKYLTTIQLAKATKKSRVTITSTAKNIPGSIKIGDRWLFPRSAIGHVMRRRSGAPKGNKNNPLGNPAWKNGYKPLKVDR